MAGEKLVFLIPCRAHQSQSLTQKLMRGIEVIEQKAGAVIGSLEHGTANCSQVERERERLTSTMQACND